MGAITPFLWFDTEAEEAAKFYVSIFPNSKITGVSHYGPGTPPHNPRPEGMVLTVEFELDGKPFVALNGGPDPKFNHAVSFAVACKDQAELDRYWEKLTDGGQPVACGWLTDRYGLSWQIVPDFVAEIPRSQAAMEAMMTMTKLDIPTLRKALGKG
jgi:predicted 3-demethylubiquinone-9 3-methyltransferase (glyoxalase superfamily)